MTRQIAAGIATRDVSLVLLAAFVAALYVVAVVVLVLHGKVAAGAALAALNPISLLAGVALGRLSGAPSTPAPSADS